MKLKKEIIASLCTRPNKHLRTLIMLKMGITESTLYRWFRENSIQLADKKVRQLLMVHLNMDITELYDLDADTKQYLEIQKQKATV